MAQLSSAAPDAPLALRGPHHISMSAGTCVHSGRTFCKEVPVVDKGQVSLELDVRVLNAPQQPKHSCT